MFFYDRQFVSNSIKLVYTVFKVIFSLIQTSILVQINQAICIKNEYHVINNTLHNVMHTKPKKNLNLESVFYSFLMLFAACLRNLTAKPSKFNDGQLIITKHFLMR